MFLNVINKYLAPIPIMDGNESQKEIISNLVDQILDNNEELETTKLDTKRTQLSAKIEYLNEKIDKLVFEIYGLSEEEIGIVEGLKK